MKKPIKISIDTITKNSTVNYDNIVKGDTLRMTINMYQNSTSLDLTGQIIDIILRKSDGYNYEKRNITVPSGNVLVVDFDIQATLAPGKVVGEIHVKDSNGICISNKFIYEVDSTVADDIVEKSRDKIETLEEIQALIDVYNANADNLAVQNQLAQQHEANLSTLNTNADTIEKRLAKDIVDGTTLAERLERDNVEGLVIANRVELDISNSNTSEAKLQAAIINGNNVITQLQNFNWKTMQSWIDLMEFISVGIPFTDENSVEFTDENNVVFTM